MEFKLDHEAIRTRAYLLSLENRTYTDLVQMVCDLEFKLSLCEPLDFSNGIIEGDPSIREYTPSYEHGRWMMLRYHSYMHRALPFQVLHWLIAEREVLIELIENENEPNVRSACDRSAR